MKNSNNQKGGEKMLKILIVGGTFSNTQNADGTYGKPSGLIKKITNAIFQNNTYMIQNNTQQEINIILFNGGKYSELQTILENNVPTANIVFWFANVDNALPKVRNVKEINPKTMLVTSKRNDDNKYSIAELINRALTAKANLLFEFNKKENKVFNIRILDPLGCLWYDGTNIDMAIINALSRLNFLLQITRQGTVNAPIETDMIAKMYFDKQFKKGASEKEFIKIIRKYADTFHSLVPHTPTDRMLGNCSCEPYRCTKGFPSRNIGGTILVSKRNVNKSNISYSDFVPVHLGKDGTLYYYGNNKPSVDSPIQVRLYAALPNILRMIHSHCYIKDAPFTERAIPCGGIEEVDEILKLIDSTSNRYQSCYKINLLGHGSIIMTHTVEELNDVEYIPRPIPEVINQKR